MQLEFIVENQRLTRTDKNFVVEKSQNYLYAHFDFKTDDWNRTLNKYAIFTNDNYNDNNDDSLMVELQDNNTCLVPHTILLDSCYFKVNLVGTDSSGNFILTTNVSNVSVNKTGSTSGISPDDPQPSILVELLEKVNKSFSNFNFEYNEENGKLLLELIDNDKVVYSKEVDLPMEQVVKNVKYDNNTKILTIEWVNGQSTEIDFSKFTDTYLGDEKTIHLENNVFSIKEEWINELNSKIDEKTSLEETDERYLKKESAIIEEHEISEAFYERITASDSTGSKYEIENGSEAKIKYLGGMTYKSENLLVFEDVEETVNNGITYSVKDGVITLNGTATQDVAIQLLFNGFNGNDVYLNTFTNDITREHHFALYTPQWETILFNFNNNTSGKVYINDGKFYRGISITIKSGDTVSNWTIKLMAVKGTTAPTEYKQGYEGIRNTAVTEIKSVGENLLNTDLLDSYDSSAIKQTDNSFISKSLGNYGAIILNGKYESTFGEVRSLNGIELSKGTYYISFKAKLNSGTSSNINTVFITRENSTQINTTSVYKPTTITSEYQTYKRSFELTENDKIGITIQVPNNVSSAIIQVKDIMISKDDIEYQPYWEDTLNLPESVTSLEGYGDGLSKTDLSKTNYVDFGRDKFVQNTQQITLNGSESDWNRLENVTTSGKVYHFVLPLTNKANATDTLRESFIISNGEIKNAPNWTYTTTNDKTLLVSNVQIMLRYDAFTTVAEIKSYLQANPITIGYLLETPIETDIDLVDRTYKVDNLGTETLVNKYNQKTFASITYGVSLKSQIIENSENIANLKNDKLDKVIGSGGTDRVYGIDMSGKQIVIPVARYDMSTNTNCLALVDNNGEVKGVTTGRTKTAFTNINYVENNFETIINSNLKVQNLQKIIDKQAKRIEQLELASEGTILSTYENVSEVSYTRLIGANVLPYGTLDKVGGMTYKSENLLNMSEYSTTVSGVKVKTSGTEISFVGTPTSQYIGFAGNNPLTTLPKGSYIMKVYDLPANYGYRMVNIQNGNDYTLHSDTVCVIPNEMSLRGILTIPSDLVNTEINLTIKVFISRTTNYINFTPISNSEYNLTKNVLTVNSLTTDGLVLSSNTVTLKAGSYNCAFIHWLKSQPTSFNTLVEIVNNKTGSVIISRTLEYKGYQQVVPLRFAFEAEHQVYLRLTVTCENLQNWECRMSLFDVNYVTNIEYKPYYSETGLRNTKVSEVISNGANLISIADKTETTTNGITYSVKNGVITLNGTSTKEFGIFFDLLKPITIGNYIHNSFNDNNESIVLYKKDFTFVTSVKKSPFTTNGVVEIIGYTIPNATTFNNYTISPMIVKGSTPPTEYKPYKAPITYSIPRQVQALYGYGIGINGDYNNHIDYERKVFVKACKVVQLGGATKLNNNVDVHITSFPNSEWSNISSSNLCILQNPSMWKDMAPLENFDENNLQFISNITESHQDKLTTGGSRIAIFTYNGGNRIRFHIEGTTTKDEAVAYLANNPVLVIYPLATPIETDISQYLAQDNVIELEALGSLTFENEHKQAVPNEITYQERNV